MVFKHIGHCHAELVSASQIEHISQVQGLLYLRPWNKFSVTLRTICPIRDSEQTYEWNNILTFVTK